MKVAINNRKGQKVAVLVEPSADPKGLVFVMHGMSAWKDEPQVATFAEAFRHNAYTVVRFDATNSGGESDGAYELATATTFKEDLEDVIAWAKRQPWYQEPFVLAGCSLGGLAVGLYAASHPSEVKALAPISTVISGKLSLSKPSYKDSWEEWKTTGWKDIESVSRPGLIWRLPWSHMEDRLKYDLLPVAGQLVMPVLMVAGENDLPEQQRLLFDKLPGEKEFHVIPGAPHTFREERHLAEVKAVLDQWIKKLEQFS